MDLVKLSLEWMLQTARFKMYNFYLDCELSLFLALDFLVKFSLYKLD